MARRVVVLVAFVLGSVACGGGGADLAGPDPSIESGTAIYTFQWVSEDDSITDGQRSFLLYVPRGYVEDPKELLPLVVFLHGNAPEAIDGPDWVRSTSGILGAAPAIAQDFAVVAPVATWFDYSGLTWRPDYVDSLITHVSSLIDVDPDRIYVVGSSWGSSGAIAYGMTYPERTAALVTAAGLWPSGLLPEELCNAADIPIRMYHGTDDFQVPVAEHERLAQGLRDCGADAELTLLEGVKHDTKVVFSEIEFYDWLLDQ